MEVKILLCADENLLNAINNLSNALGGLSLKTKAESAEINNVTSATSETKNEDYTMFQDMAKAAKKLQIADEEAYEKILHKYVGEGKKYSAILPKDWGNATAEFKKTLNSVSKKVKSLEAEELVEVEGDDFEDADTPRLTIKELRALASKASNAGVKVGAILNNIGNTKKVSALDPSLYNAVEDAIREDMKKLEG